MIRRSLLALLAAAPAGAAMAQDLFVLKPIVKAVREGDEEKVRQALLKGESPNQGDAAGQPLLVVAVMAGQTAVVETLLKGGALVDAPDKEGSTDQRRPPRLQPNHPAGSRCQDLEITARLCSDRQRRCFTTITRLRAVPRSPGPGFGRSTRQGSDRRVHRTHDAWQSAR